MREEPVRQVRIKRAMAISGSASGSGFQNEITSMFYHKYYCQQVTCSRRLNGCHKL